MKKAEVKVLLRMTRGMDPETVQQLEKYSQMVAQGLKNIQVEQKLGLLNDKQKDAKIGSLAKMTLNTVMDIAKKL
ncbi:hypothetical protein [Macrococcus equipercicus]|uniref:Uncharacterized protein n=1 Tax=Macrococcus equipercicus TaxID=69967 RepID=A0A9Q9BWP6_9STAP|nr:hypothetical protein [Macrococcus equipercicus]UTH14762.1 hypothetical protein KFV11_05275 [Macrococcus equipercicus]